MLRKIAAALLILVLCFSLVYGEEGDNMATANIRIDDIQQHEITVSAYYYSDAGTLIDRIRFYCNGSLFQEIPVGGENDYSSPGATKSGLLANTEYTFQIRCYLYPYDGRFLNSSGTGWTTSGYSDTTTEFTGGDPPTDNVVLSKSSVTQSTVHLSWTGGTGATGYRVYQDGEEIFNTGVKNMDVDNLDPGTTYEFYVEAYNNAGSVYSNTVTVTTSPPAPPSSITDLQGWPDYTFIDLTWNGGTNADYFEIYKNGVLIDTVYYTHAYTVDGLTEGTSYTLKVKAVNAYGSTSSTITATTISHRPTNFSGFNSLVSGADAVVPAADWNSFNSKVNEFRNYKGYPPTTFPTVAAGQTITADIYNITRNAVIAMVMSFTGGNTIPADKVKDVDNVYPSDFTRLRDALNSIL